MTPPPATLPQLRRLLEVAVGAGSPGVARLWGRLPGDRPPAWHDLTRYLPPCLLCYGPGIDGGEESDVRPVPMLQLLGGLDDDPWPEDRYFWGQDWARAFVVALGLAHGQDPGESGDRICWRREHRAARPRLRPEADRRAGDYWLLDDGGGCWKSYVGWEPHRASEQKHLVYAPLVARESSDAAALGLAVELFLSDSPRIARLEGR